MSTISLETPVGQLVAERPARSRIFEQLGIDYCCGGRKPLGEVCQAKGLDPNAVLGDLEGAEALIAGVDTDWTKASLTDLSNHIETTHHAYVRESLPRLTALIEKVSRAHGANDARLGELRDLFVAFRADFEAHLAKEELILFPLCRQMDGAPARPEIHCGSVTNPIHVMVSEHDDAGECLLKFRELTDDFTPPQGACNTYRAMLQALEELEADTHQHVHKENNILFPKAVAAENALS